MINPKKNEIETLSDEYLIPLSLPSKSIQQLIIQPEHLRTPVNYNRQFLDQYQPNLTMYLSETERKHLYDIGKTNGGYPAGTYARQMLNRLLIDLSWNSSRLEGNTYSLLETERLLKMGKLSEGKEDGEACMLINHKDTKEGLFKFPVSLFRALDVVSTVPGSQLTNAGSSSLMKDLKDRWSLAL
jgi:hypothetical protein